MWIYGYLVLFLVGAVLTETTDEYRVVNITQGPVRGRRDPEGGVYSFYNIPYATAPTGRNRFKAPLDPPVWMHTFDAVDKGITCPQPGNIFNMQEDCLVANVFTPDTNDTNLPVLVNFHGGSYQHFHGNYVKHNNLVRTRRLIVVSFNYRLGAQGFLCLGTEAIPGNAGLKDQVALLRWVKTTIASFGGNPEEVTIAGCSAGSGSVDAMTLSGITSGLFKRANMDSGVAFGVVGLQRDPVANAQTYARLLNFDNVDDLDALGEFYTSVSFQELYSRHDVISNNYNGSIWFSPCVERDVGEERVIEEAPMDIIVQGKYNKVPLLFGFTNMEGLLRMPLFESWKDKMNERFADFLPYELEFESEEVKNEVAKNVKEFYFGDKPVGEETVLNYIDYFTDTQFAFPMLKSLKARVESLDDTIYLFEYSFADENSPSIPHTDEKGADHCDQLRAVTDQNKTGLTPDYRQMKEIMREYWFNFISTGSPWVEGSELVQWPPASANRTPHISLGRTVELKGILLEDRVAFWEDIYEKYYKAPKPPGGAASSYIISKVLISVVIFLHLYY